MSRRENIIIKTKYKTIETCERNCVDSIGTKRIAKSWSNKLYGVFDDTHHFMITSDARGAALFVFEGVIVERDDHINMEGDIKLRPMSKKIVTGSILVGLLVGILLISTLNAVFMLMGTLFMIVPWFNYLYVKKSDALYSMIHKKVS